MSGGPPGPPPPPGQLKLPNWKDKPKPPPNSVQLWQVDPKSEGFKVAKVSETNLDDIAFYSRIEGGSGGVFILNSTTSGVMVVKSAGQVFQEIYALEFGKALNLLIPTTHRFYLPETVVFSRETESFDKVISSLRSLEPRRTGGLGMDSHKIARLAQQNHIELMEFVVGTTFRYLSMEQAHAAFTHPATLDKLASIVVFDIILNNYDRVPIPVWSNDGNPKNVLVHFDVETENHQLIAIDQCVTAINDETGLKAYCNKVRTFVGNCYGSSIDHLETVREWIPSFTGYDLTDDNLYQLNEALKVVFKAISALNCEKFSEENIRQNLSVVEERTRSSMGEMNTELDSVFKVNMFLNREFILLIWETIRDKVLEIAPEDK